MPHSKSHVRRAGRMLVLSLLAVACAALVDNPWPALALCGVAVTAAGVVTGFAHGSAARGAIAPRTRPSPTILSLGALGYLVGLPATWRALHALEDLGHASGSPWRWAPLAAGSVVFALGYGLATRSPRGPEG